MRKNLFEDDTDESPRPIKRRSFGEDTIEWIIRENRLRGEKEDCKKRGTPKNKCNNYSHTKI